MTLVHDEKNSFNCIGILPFNKEFMRENNKQLDFNLRKFVTLLITYRRKTFD